MTRTKAIKAIQELIEIASDEGYKPQAENARAALAVLKTFSETAKARTSDAAASRARSSEKRTD